MPVTTAPVNVSGLSRVRQTDREKVRRATRRTARLISQPTLDNLPELFAELRALRRLPASGLVESIGAWSRPHLQILEKYFAADNILKDFAVLGFMTNHLRVAKMDGEFAAPAEIFASLAGKPGRAKELLDRIAPGASRDKLAQNYLKAGALIASINTTPGALELDYLVVALMVKPENILCWTALADVLFSRHSDAAQADFYLAVARRMDPQLRLYDALAESISRSKPTAIMGRVATVTAHSPQISI